MKIRLLIIVLLAACGLVAAATTYRAEDVPNVHLADRTRFTSNPDSILSREAEQRVDRAVASVRNTSTAEMAVVVVDDIDPQDIDGFATELFGLWGLGKNDRDNGVLVVVAKDMRKAVIRTGYGVEGVLPDIICSNILRHTMFPAFREGDFDRGVAESVETIAGLLNDPDAAEELRSRLEDADNRSQDSGTEMWHGYLAVAAAVAVIMLIVLVVRLISLRGRTRFERYRALNPWRPVYLILGFATLGMGMVAAVILVLVLNFLRNGRRLCPNCGTVMQKQSEERDNDFLTPSQDLEERLGSVDYDVWVCPACGETDVLPYVNSASSFQECESCHTRAARLSADRILRRATPSQEGYGVKEYTCLNCHHITRRPYKLAKTAPVVIMP
ncbi:MAG: TPM domain-containing protein, partial [Muribaculaceae bacterium]|nr:TPM domain-containing protein [Muribaculaceae bacterium]